MALNSLELLKLKNKQKNGAIQVEELVIRNNQITEDYYMVKAEKKHFDIILEILLDAAQWLRSQGLQQWGHFLDGYGRDDIANSLNNGTVYLLVKKDHVVGTVTIQLTPDEWDHYIWGDVDLEQSIFIHRLALARSEAGRGLGKTILQWIETEIDLPVPKKFIKLDCVGDNPKLNQFYLRNGYRFMGNASEGFCKYQKEIDILKAYL